jgi:hypothetical protein
VVLTDLIRQSSASAATLFCEEGWMLSSRGVVLVQGEHACVQGELFIVLELWIGGFCSLLEHVFVSDVSSCCPYLRGPRLLFFK